MLGNRFDKKYSLKGRPPREKTNELRGAKILITGGTGTFGRAFLDRCLEEDAEEVRILSRDEKKQYDMAQLYKKHGNVKFYLGDIRDKRTVDNAMYGVDYVFHAAAMKQVPSCETFPMEAVATNINGSYNVMSSAVQKHVKKVVCLSTDKAVYPTSAMGMTKAYMEKLALQKAAENSRTEFVITRFGNLVASRGSAVPLFMEQVENGLPITITDPNMTRFMMTVSEAANLVETAFRIGNNGELLVKQAPSCSTGDLAKAVCRYFDLSEDYPTEIIGARPGEKMHEALLTEEEAENATIKGDFIVVSKSNTSYVPLIVPYTSDTARRMDEDEVLALIEHVFEGGVN